MDVRKVVEGYQYYDGKKEHMKLSASQVSRDVLELYLAATEDSQEGHFGKGNIGSIFHMGMDSMMSEQLEVKGGSCVVEKRFSRMLPNGWKIDGKMDMVAFMKHVINDWKGMSASAYTKFKSNKKDHSINMQFAVYNWLLGGDFAAEAHCFITDWDPCNDTHPATAYQPVTCNIYTPEEIEAYMIEKTDLLAGYLAAAKLPPKCENVMPRQLRSGVYINSKCEYYCNHSHVCKRKRDDTAKKLGLDWGRK